MLKKLFFVLILFIFTTSQSQTQINIDDFNISSDMDKIVSMYKTIETTNDEFIYQIYVEDLEYTLRTFLIVLLENILNKNKDNTISKFIKKYESIDKEYKFLFEDCVLILNKKYYVNIIGE
jgi:hypothetical protein